MLDRDKLQVTVDKMIRIVRADTGASGLYRDMLLSLLPNSAYEVNLSYWNYKADRDDFKTMLELMIMSHTDLLFEYEAMIEPFKDELVSFEPSE